MSQHASPSHPRSRSSSSAARRAEEEKKEEEQLAQRRAFAKKRYAKLFEQFTQLKQSAPESPLDPDNEVHEAWEQVLKAVEAAGEGPTQRVHHIIHLAEYENVAELEFKVFELEFSIETYNSHVHGSPPPLTAEEKKLSELDDEFQSLGHVFLEFVNKTKRMKIPQLFPIWRLFEKCAEWRIKGRKNRSEGGIKMYHKTLRKFDALWQKFEPGTGINESQFDDEHETVHEMRKNLRDTILTPLEDPLHQEAVDKSLDHIYDHIRKKLPKVEYKSTSGSPETQHSLAKIGLSARHQRRYKLRE